MSRGEQLPQTYAGPEQAVPDLDFQPEAKLNGRTNDLRRMVTRPYRFMPFIACAFALVWAAVSASLLGVQKPVIRRVGTIGMPPGLDRIVERYPLDSTAVGLLDQFLNFNCLSTSLFAQVSIEDPDNTVMGNYFAWPDHGYLAWHLSGKLELIARDGTKVWQRDVGTDFGCSLEDLPAIALPGNDGRLYLLTDGCAFIYAGSGAPLDMVKLDPELELAGPLLASSAGEIYFSTRSGELKRAQYSADHADWEVTTLPGWNAGSFPWLIAEGCKRDGSRLEESRVFIVTTNVNISIYEWSGADGSSIRGNLKAGDEVEVFERIRGGNLVVIREPPDGRRFYWDTGFMKLTSPVRDIFTPLGEMQLSVDRDSGSLWIMADDYSRGGGWQVLNVLATRWPSFDGLLKLHGRGLLHYDAALHRNTVIDLPARLMPLTLPDAAGNFIAAEPAPFRDQCRVAHYRVAAE